MWWILAGTVVLAGILFYTWQNLTIGVAHLSFESDRVAEELSVGLFSDLHAGWWLTDVRSLAQRQQFDLIVLAGDVFDEKRNGNDRTMDLVGKLRAMVPCVYVPGNHEYRIENKAALLDGLRAANVTVLENELCALKIRDQRITIAGLDAAVGQTGHFHTARPTEKQLALLRELSQSGGVRIVLDHYPENYALRGEDSYNKFEFEMMLSGHAHGGQVRLPILGGLYAPGQGKLPKYTAGMYQTKKNRLIVSRGMGGRWYLPRVFNRAQIVTIHILPKMK